MRVTYDARADAAYIYLADTNGYRHGRTVPCDPEMGMINLDFDIEGRLIGIEVIDASKLLPQALLDESIKDGQHGI